MNGFQSLQPILRLFFRTKGTALLAGIATATVTVLAGIALLGLSGWFITATAIAGMSIATAVVFDVFAPAAGIRLLAILRTGSRYLERLVTHDATLAILAALREKLFRSWARPSAANTLLKRPARLLFRLTADIDALDSLYLRVVVPIGAALATALVAGIALGLMNPIFGLVVATVLLAAGLCIPLAAARRSEKSMRRRAKGTEALRARTVDLVAGQTELLMAGRLADQKLALARADGYIAASDRRLNRIEIVTGAGFGIVHASLLAGGLVAVGLLMQAETIGAPVAALGMLVILGAMEPFSALRRGAMELGRTVLAAKRVAPQLTDEAEPAAPQRPANGKAVQLKSVSARHEGAERDALKNITLDIAAGERVAIVGTSGAGKSTLFSLLAGEIQATQGSVAVLPTRLLTQRTELFQDSLRDNLRLARADAGDHELMDALDAAGLGTFIRELPAGLDAMLGEGGLGLSGGQARRLALARLFLTDAPLWLLDEPTEGLDNATAEDVLERLKARAGSRTLLIATHIRREARICERIIVLNQGALIESVGKETGRFDEILENMR
ncbi:thiol reductant ABC exporter subunit CydC [Brucella intermedia]|uniref:Thiol reductant ABC exporter subunit CydC n=2 Tax=Brucella/Ochrobactrum group TaxID=2826938 RepID=A0AA42GXL6_9HYPH|nr:MULTISPECIES: thiol reductant ABC exporter subunit CydC [Brucella/Ochrobactrum group]ERI15116.1 ABC transporter ATP-binding protein [Ochrobactrum sp. EGD-AQ16]PJT21593.1 thiol reductant ABC exporter subunit CydC [Ochrobactrum sp. 30A/1000/2015]PJT39803.1 thiol reductant ABC exporter subunit CydC [Ochrobactrum sp. 27A/999/2015]PJT44096.1 thiol reductant ABC exporter subunit CydC [Ochrobactrum sp. 23A/997/2015]BBA73264.1 cysteine ABC transporter permease/ATP-binding protein [Ochrobactrum sp. 